MSKTKDIHHGVFTRCNGFSQSEFSSLNVSQSVGDRAENIIKNKSAISSVFNTNDIVFTSQVHKTDIIAFNKTGKPKTETDFYEYVGDGLVTNVLGVPIAIKLADCQAIILYDPQQKIIANVHSGWRGSIQNIIGKCVNIMQSDFGSNPADIIAGISPSLGPCCAEFKNYKVEIPNQFWMYQVKKNYFNFWKISFDQLVDAGVVQDNIETSNICTKCNAHLFFSYRKDKKTGRFASVIGLKPDVD